MTSGYDHGDPDRRSRDDAFGWVAERPGDPYALDSGGEAGPYDPYAVPADPYAPAADPYAASAPGFENRPGGHPVPPAPPLYGGLPAPAPSSGAAITGFVLGLVGLVMCGGLTSPFGIFFSARGMKETAPTALETRSGRGLAVAGLVTSLIGLIPLLFMLVYAAAMIVAIVMSSTA